MATQVYTVRGNEDGKGYDTFSGILWTFWNANKGLHGHYHNNFNEFYQEELRVNGLSEHSARSKCGSLVNGVVTLHPGAHVELPAGEMPKPPRFQEKSCIVPHAVRMAAPAPEEQIADAAPPPPPVAVAQPSGIPLAVWADAGGAGQLTTGAFSAYDHLNYAILHGEMPNQPHTAARGDNPNKPQLQTTGDELRAFTNPLIIPAQVALSFAARGPVGGALVQTHSGADRADRWQNAKEGSPNTGHDDYIDTRNQWPFNGELNPFSPSEAERKSATFLPGWHAIDPQTGSIVSPDPKFAYIKGTNPLYTTADESPSITSNETGVRSGHTKENDVSWGTPSKPQTLVGASNYAQSWDVNNRAIVPQLEVTMNAYKAATDPAAKHQAAQDYVDLINYQSTLTFIKGDPLRHAQTLEYRDGFIAKAAAEGVTGLDPYHMKEQAPDHSITKAELQANMVKYYTTMATEGRTDSHQDNRGQFDQIYRDLVDPKARINYRDSEDEAAGKEAIKKAVLQVVDALPLMQKFPEKGVYIPTDRFVSTRDPNHPTDVRFDNLNPIERGEFLPKTQSTDPKVVAEGIKRIAGNENLTKRLLEGAGRDPHIAEAIIQRDRLSIDLPRAFDPGHEVQKSRDAAMIEIAGRGYSDKTLQEVFGILHQKDGSLAFDKSPGSGQIGNASAPVDSATLTRMMHELGESANSPAIVAIRQQDIGGMAIDGEHKATFPVGALASRTLFALTTERGITTLKAMEADIGSSGAPDSAETIEALRQGIDYAKNDEHAKRVGVYYDHALDDTHGVQKTYGEAEEAIRAKAKGLNVDAAGIVSASARDDLKTYNTLVTIGSNGKAAQDLVGAIATAQAGDVLKDAAKLDDTFRIQIAKAAMGNDDSIKNLLTGAAKARFSPLKPTTLTADDATFVLTTLAADPLRAAPALRNIATHVAASQSVVKGVLTHDLALGATVLSSLSADQQKTLADGAQLPPNAFETTGHQPIAQLHPNETVRQVIAAADDVGRASVLLNQSDTQAIALHAVAQDNPVLMQKAILETLVAHPEMVKAVRKGLTKAGAQRDTGIINSLFHTNDLLHYDSEAKLGNIIGGLADALKNKDKEAIAEYKAELTAFVSADPKIKQGQQNRLALADLNALVLSGSAAGTNVSIGGVGKNQHAVASTLVAAMQGSLTGATQATSTEEVTALVKAAKDLPDLVVNAAPVDTKALAAAGAAVADSVYTDSGWQLPLILFPTGLGKKPGANNPPLNQGNPGNCTINGVQCGITPPPPPPTPPIPSGPIGGCTLNGAPCIGG